MIARTRNNHIFYKDTPTNNQGKYEINFFLIEIIKFLFFPFLSMKK